MPRLVALAAASWLAAQTLTFVPGGAPRWLRPGCQPRRVELGARAAALEVDGTLEPLGSYVLVEVAEAEETTKAGLLLPKAEKPRGGTVVAAGPGEANAETGVLTPVLVKPSTKVMYSRYGGSGPVEFGGKEHMLIREDEILFSFQGEEPSLENIQMPRGKVLVKLPAPEEVTEGGFILSKQVAKQSSTVGEVIAVGPGEIGPSGEEIPPPVEVGDTVRFRYGDEVDLDVGDDSYKAVKTSNCIAKWKAA